MTTFASLPLHLLVSSPTNPRKTFDAAKLAELTASIQASGVHQPILVRPLPGSRMAETFDTGQPGMPRPTHEIVAGERRYRASIQAFVPAIPAMIRELTDNQVLEIQLVENLQRADLSELEEAEGYELLMQHTGINANALGDKIGKSRSYVYSRLKLLDLCQECKQAMRLGLIDVSRAILLARIPDGQLQIKALTYATEAHAGEVPSERALQVWLRQNVMLQLDRAPFQVTAANLVPLAGSCKSCPKRTGAAPDIFSDVDGADICTDPPCYNQKCEAHLAELQHQADKRGMRLVYGPEAKAICYEKSGTLRGYSPLSQVRQDLTGSANGKRLDHLLSPSPAVPIEGAVLIENPFTRELIAAIPTVEAEAALLAKGLIEAVEAKASKADKAGSYAATVSKLKAATEPRINTKYEELLQAALVQAVVNTDDDKTPHLLSAKVLIAAYAHEVKYYAGKQTLELMDLAGKQPDELTDAQIYQFAALFLAVGDSATSEALAKENGVPLSRLWEDAKAHVKAEVAAEIEALKLALKPAKSTTPTTPLAQPSVLPVATAQTQKPTPAAPRGKARLSAQAAQSGIAAAMQNLEAPPAGVEAVPLDAATPKLKPGPQVKAQGQLGVGFAIGQRVRVTQDTDKLGQIASKHANKQGQITAKEPGGGYWTVTFRGRNGGVALFAEDQIDAVQS